MSVIIIDKNKTEGKEGIERTIDQTSISLVIDAISVDQYKYPENSIVRELCSNALDSQKEKEEAIAIVTGERKEEDFYIKRTDEKYKDSIFDRNYYNLNYLNRDKNYVELEYVYGKDAYGWCDKFIIRDFGVGLGDYRLEGYFQIGFSTKRNSLNKLGSYGFGSKVGLALRNDYYLTTTVHNGKMFRFQCYAYKMDSLIGKFNSNGEENEYITFNDKNKTKVYYEKTDKLNFTEITVPCKTHHRNKIRQAVESQLLYMSGVKFFIDYGSGEREEQNFKADILYNSENIVIADQYQYSRPHILIVKDKKSSDAISYGYVNFKDMEMQDLYSAIGFKCPIRQTIRNVDGSQTVIQEGVSVTSSREECIWDDHTREYVKKVIENAAKEASQIVENELNETDILLWLSKANNILSKTGQNKILDRLSRIVDVNDLNPKFPLQESISYTHPGLFFWGLSVRGNYRRYNDKNQKQEIQRDDLTNWVSFDIENVYFQTENTSFYKDMYLIENNTKFITIKIEDKNSIIEKYVKPTEYDENGKEKANKWTLSYVTYLLDKRDKLVELIKKSSKIKNYDDVIVPEDYHKKLDEDYKIDEETQRIEKLSPQELRKLNEKTVVYFPESEQWRKDNKLFKFVKQEPTISELREFDNLYYGYGEDEEKISILSILLFQSFKSKGYSRFYNDNFKLIRISKSLPKNFIKKHKHVDKLIKKQNKNQIVMSLELIRWNTARLVYEKLDDLKFFQNYSQFNSELYQIYIDLKSYSTTYYKTVNHLLTKYEKGETIFNSIIEENNKIVEFQLYIRDNKNNAESIKMKSLDLFGIDSLNQAFGIDLEIYDKLQNLLNYAEPIKDLFNHVDCLINNKDISLQTEVLINEILTIKHLNDFKIPDVNKQEEVMFKEESVQEKTIIELID